MQALSASKNLTALEISAAEQRRMLVENTCGYNLAESFSQAFICRSKQAL
jgi:hypothetical protein